MSRRNLGRAIDEDVLRMVNGIKQITHDIAHFCITADAWTCQGKSRGFVGVTLHWVKY